MPLDFLCSSCGQNLRVSDEHAGKRVKCPNCASEQIAPEAIPFSNPPSQPFDLGQPRVSPGQNPYETGPAISPTPQASSIPVAIDGPIVNYVPDISEIIGHSFLAWKENLGILLIITLITMGISMGVSFAQTALVSLVQAGGQDNFYRVMSIQISCYFLGFIIQSFLQAGQFIVMLNVLRGKPAEANQLFQAGDIFGKYLGLSFLMAFALMIGFLLLIVPGVIMLALFWPAGLLVVDKKMGVFEAIRVSREVTRGNGANFLLLALCSFGISLLATLACCFPLIFVSPLVVLFWVTAYLSMSSQLQLR